MQTPPDQQDRREAASERRRREHLAAVAKTSDLARRAERCLIWAGVTDDALAHADELRSPWKHLVSADPGVYASWFMEGWEPNVEDVIPILRPIVDRLAAYGCAVYSWCDCRPAGDGTPAQAAIDLVEELDLDGWVGQAETPGELVNSVGIHEDGTVGAPQGSERAQVIVGNPNAWTADQRATAIRMVNEGDLAVIGEVYNGCPDTYSAQGVAIAAMCLGVAMDGELHYPLQMLLGRVQKREDSAVFLPTFGVWHAAGLDGDDWAALKASA